MIKLCLGDITETNVESIVNSIHPHLINCYGNGVDAKIKKLCGEKLIKEFKDYLGPDRYHDNTGLDIGHVFMTNSYNMDCKRIIHIVTPLSLGSSPGKAYLKKGYKKALDIAKKNNIKEIMFPNLCTGYYNARTSVVAPLAADAINDWINNNNEYNIDIYIDSYSKADLDTYEDIFKEKDIEYDICDLPTNKSKQ